MRPHLNCKQAPSAALGKTPGERLLSSTERPGVGALRPCGLYSQVGLEPGLSRLLPVTQTCWGQPAQRSKAKVDGSTAEGRIVLEVTSFPFPLGLLWGKPSTSFWKVLQTFRIHQEPLIYQYALTGEGEKAQPSHL